LNVPRETARAMESVEALLFRASTLSIVPAHASRSIS
jgi:hypothetical protein